MGILEKFLVYLTFTSRLENENVPFLLRRERDIFTN